MSAAGALLLSLGLGGLLGAAFLAGSSLRGARRGLLIAALAPGLAAGAASIVHVGFAGARLPAPGALAHAGIVVAIALGIARFARGRPEPAATGRAPVVAGGRLELALAPLIVVAAAMLIRGVLEAGWGGWDAHAWWNHLARVLDRGYGDLPDGLVNTNYPLLVPGWIAAVWSIAGAESPLVSQLAAAAWAFGVLGLVWVTTAGHRPLAAGLPAAATVFASGPLLFQATTQYADLPVAYFVLAAGGLLYRGRDEGMSRGEWALAGTLLGLLAWTKNEGAIWAAGLLAAVAADRLRRPRGEGGIAWLPLAAGALPAAAALLAYKTAWASPWGSQSVGQMLAGDWLARLFDPARWRLPLRALASELGPTFAGPGRDLATTLVAGLVVHKLARRRPLSPGERILGLYLIFFVACLVGIYVLTPQPQAWHVQSSFGRLALHAMPLAALLAFGEPFGQRAAPGARGGAGSAAGRAGGSAA